MGRKRIYKVQRRSEVLRRVAVAVMDGDTEGQGAVVSGATEDRAVFVFHGASRGLLTTVLDRLRTVMMDDYEIRRVRMADMANGKCPDYLEVTVTRPDFQLAAPREWCRLMGVMMNRCCRVELTICATYEQFLNL